MEFTINIKTLWKNNKGWILAGLLTVLGTVYAFTKDVVDDYMGRQEQIHFNKNIIEAFKTDTIVEAVFENEEFVDLLFESSVVRGKVAKLSEELSTEIRNAIIDDVSKQDTNKISTRAEMSKRLDIREENYFPLLEKALKAVLKEENASKGDVKTIIRRNIKSDAIKPAQF